MPDWTSETAPWYRMGWTHDIAENYLFPDPQLRDVYRKKLKEQIAAVGEGFCPEDRIRLIPSVSMDGVSMGGKCPNCKTFYIIDGNGLWFEHSENIDIRYVVE